MNHQDSDLDVLLGKEQSLMKGYFNNNTNLDLSIKNAKQLYIGKTIIKELICKNEGIKKSAIVKSLIETSSDNLIYEGLVGKYLNRIGLRYPCFLETYGIYRRDFGLIHGEEISITLDDLKCAAENPLDFFCILQYLNKSETLLDKTIDDDFMRFDLLYALFQVYAPLAFLRNEFTHYDLHYENFLLIEQENNSYIEYHYYLNNGEVVTFKSKYITKIIDYGKCFFNDTENNDFYGSSEKIYDELNKLRGAVKVPPCKNTQCDVMFCGGGFGMFYKKYLVFSKCNKGNQSCDIRLLKMLSQIPKFYLSNLPDILKNMLKKILYNSKYETEEIIESGLPNSINNVLDAFIELKSIIKDHIIVSENNKYYENLNKLGDLHIYENGKYMNYYTAK